MRAVDDKIIYKLNTSVPTISFADQVSASDECKHLYEQVRHNYDRDPVIHINYQLKFYFGVYTVAECL
jgi:hypothetical protein